MSQRMQKVPKHNFTDSTVYDKKEKQNSIETVWSDRNKVQQSLWLPKPSVVWAHGAGMWLNSTRVIGSIVKGSDGQIIIQPHVTIHRVIPGKEGLI